MVHLTTSHPPLCSCALWGGGVRVADMSTFIFPAALLIALAFTPSNSADLSDLTHATTGGEGTINDCGLAEDGSDGKTDFRTFTNAKGQAIEAAPLRLKIPEVWDESKLELLLRNNRKVWIPVKSLSEKDQAFLKRWGAANAGTTGIRLRCKSTSRSRESATSWYTSYGSFDKQIVSEGALNITVENLRRSTRVVEVEWSFLARSAAGKGNYFIFDGGSKTFRIDPLDDVSFKTDVATTVARDTNYAALRERYISGSKYFGWLAITRTDGQITSIESSHAPVRELYSDKVGWNNIVKR